MASRSRAPRKAAAEPPQPSAPAADLAEISSFCPPKWRKPWHRTADLGYPDYLPPRLGQSEEEMTPDLVKYGFTGRSLLSASLETFNAHSLIHDGFAKHGQIHLHMLGQLMHDVFVRQSESLPRVGPSTFKLSSKVTVHDSKRDSWIADLANPNVPLGKLAASSIPHPYKGHDLLDMLYNQRIPIDRAIWYVRVLGANETHIMRGKPDFKPTQYSIEWANIVTSHLKKQLGDVVLPSAPRPGLTIRQSTFQNVLGNPESRAKWVARFSHSFVLLREFFAESLVDHATFLTWLASLAGTANLAQVGLVSLVADEYLEGLVEHRGFLRPFLEGCLGKLGEIEASPVKEYLSHVAVSLSSLIQRAFLVAPDCFVSFRLWNTHHATLRAILVDSPKSAVPILASNENDGGTAVMLSMLVEIFHDVDARNSALSFKSLPKRAMVSLRLTMLDIQALNAIDATTDLSNFRFFESSSGQESLGPGITSSSKDTFAAKLDVLLTWAVTSQCGDHSPYAAATILRSRYERSHRQGDGDSPTTKKRRKGQTSTKKDGIMQDDLFHWLDTSPVARNHTENLESTALLFGYFIQKGLFSYGKFIQKLIARGETGAYSDPDRRSHLLTILHAIPIFSPSPLLFAERKAALFGMVQAPASGVDAPWDEAARKELTDLVPEVFGGVGEMPNEPSSILAATPSFLNASQFDQFRIIYQWVIPALRQHTSRRRLPSDHSPISAYAYSVIMFLLGYVRCYPAILELSLLLMRDPAPPSDLLLPILDSLRMHHEVWSCMDALGDISSALYNAHERLRARSIVLRPLLAHLIEVDQGERLSPDARAQVLDDLASLEAIPDSALRRAEPPQPFLPEILNLYQDLAPHAAENLATALRYQYNHHSGWGWVVWDSVFTSLRHMSQSTPSLPFEAQLAATLRYAALLETVDSHLSVPLEQQITNWMLEHGHQEFCTLDEHTWVLFTHLLLRLVVSGTLGTSMVLRGVVYFVWKSVLIPKQSSPVPMNDSKLVEAVNTIAGRLLLPDDVSADATFHPQTIIDIQHFRANTFELARPADFAALSEGMALLVSLECNPKLEEGARSSSLKLRVAVCTHPRFTAVAFRKIDVVRDAFLKPIPPEMSPDGLEARLAEALKLIVVSTNESTTAADGHREALSYDLQTIVTRLNPWGFSRAMIELQLTLKQMGEGLTRPESRAQAEIDLTKFTTSFLGHPLSPEETDLVADVLRGINGFVAEQFINRGFQRLTQILAEYRAENANPDIDTLLRTAGEVLRLMASVVQPLRNPGQTLPNVEEAVQDAFADAITGCLLGVLRSLKEGTAGKRGYEDPNGVIPSKTTDTVLLLARLLQFNLGLPGIWTSKFKMVAQGLLPMTSSLALFYGGSLVTDPILFPILLDTAGFILDELPKDNKVTVDPKSKRGFDLKDIDSTHLPPSMPPSFRSRLSFILSYVPADHYTKNLVHGSRSASASRLVAGFSGEPVQSKPWEWIEYIDPSSYQPPASKSSKRDSEAAGKGDTNPNQIRLPNVSALSLEYFSIKATGELVRSEADRMTDNGAQVELRNAADRFHAEAFYERDWREGRVVGSPISSETNDEGSDEDGVGSIVARTETDDDGDQRMLGFDSPVTTSEARGSTISARSKGKATTAQPSSKTRQGSSHSQPIVEREVIDVDALESVAPNRGLKRKASTTSAGVAGGSGSAGARPTAAMEAVPPLKRKSTSNAIASSVPPGRGKGKRK